MKVVTIRTTGEYPCQWDDLVEVSGATLATIYTLQEVKKEGCKPGIRRGTDGVYDIVVPVTELGHTTVKEALKDLEKITGMRYVLSV